MDVNLTAVLGAATITGAFTFLVMRSSKHYDARSAAEAALIGTGPTIIAEQNKRIASMQTEINNLWAQMQQSYKSERECREQLTDFRHQNRDLATKIYALEKRLGLLEDC